MKLLERLHGSVVAGRRARRLAEMLAELIPSHALVLDVGCGDGQVAMLLGQHRPDIQIRGLDPLVRANAFIPVTHFDGVQIPFADSSFDAVLFIDVLHHTDHPQTLLQEARRVTRDVVLVKDHLREGLWAGSTLRFMDCVGNRRFGVPLPYQYFTRREWQHLFERLDLAIDTWEEELALYPRPFKWIFERRLHFLSRLRVPPQSAASSERP